MANVEYFLTLEGIVGESTDEKHPGAIQIESFTWGATQQAALGGGRGGAAVGKSLVSDFQFAARASAASPKIFATCMNGRHLKTAVLNGRKAGEESLDFLQVTLSDVLVLSYQQASTEASEGSPLEQITLSFSKIETEHRPMSADGSVGEAVRAGWDLRANKSL